MALLDEAISYIGDRPLGPATALCYVPRALILRRYQRYDEAEQALDDAERHFGDVRWGLARVLSERGSLALARGDVPRALELLEEAVGRLEIIKGPTRPWARLNLGRARLAAGDLDGADEMFRDELFESRKRKHAAAELVAELGLLNLAAVRRDWRSWRDGLANVNDLLTERENTTRDAIGMIEEAARVVLEAGNRKQAVAAFMVALEAWKKLGLTTEATRVEQTIEGLRAA